MKNLSVQLGAKEGTMDFLRLQRFIASSLMILTYWAFLETSKFRANVKSLMHS